MKRTSSNSPRSAWWTWHISAPILCMAPLSLSSPLHLRFALSRSLLQYLSPLWLVPHHRHHPHPNTKPEPRYHQCCCDAKPGLSGSSCASVLLPMPHRRQISAKYVVKSSNLRNSHKDISMPSTAFFSYLLWWSHMWSQVKWKEQAQIHSDLHDGTSVSPFHLRLALSGSILPYLPPSWPIPQHPHQTPSLSPGSTNVVVIQNQVCQGRVVLQSFCQCLTQDVQNTQWNHLILEIHIKTSQCLLLHSSHTCSDDHICGLKWNEKNKLKFT